MGEGRNAGAWGRKERGGCRISCITNARTKSSLEENKEVSEDET